MLIKGAIHQENTIINFYAPNFGTPNVIFCVHKNVLESVHIQCTVKVLTIYHF